MTYHIISHIIYVSYRITYHFITYHVIPDLVISYISYHIPYLICIISYHISCHIVSYHISYHIISYSQSSVVLCSFLSSVPECLAFSMFFSIGVIPLPFLLLSLLHSNDDLNLNQCIWLNGLCISKVYFNGLNVHKRISRHCILLWT